MSSPPPKAKFAPRSPRPSSAFTDAERRAFALAEEVHGLAVGIVDAAIAEVVFEGEGDPKVYGLTLLCRSISNFRGALTMARLDQAVESRTLVRSCFENLFLVDQLRKDGAGFVKKMRSHEAKIRILLGHLALKHHGSAESPFGQIVRDLIKSERLMSPEKLAVSDTAEGEMEKRYLAYLLLSHDAAHALSLVALERHFQLHQGGRMTMNVIPSFLPGERLATLDMACDAVLGACMGISLVLGVTSQNEVVHALSERFLHQGRHAAPLDRASSDERAQ
jgi:hypothetical protein